MFCFALFLNSARRLYFNPMDWNLKSLASMLPLCNDDSFSKFSGSKPPCSFTLICELTVHLYFNLKHYSFFLPQMLILKVCSSILYIIQIIWNLSMIRPLTSIHVHDPFFQGVFIDCLKFLLSKKFIHFWNPDVYHCWCFSSHF